MTIRCPRRECAREFDTAFNKITFDKDKGHGYICPFCYGFIKMIRYREKPAPRAKPHASKKERRRQREAIKPVTPAKESAC
jgi:hypothetical protein